VGAVEVGPGRLVEGLGGDECSGLAASDTTTAGPAGRAADAAALCSSYFGLSARAGDSEPEAGPATLSAIRKAASFPGGRAIVNALVLSLFWLCDRYLERSILRAHSSILTLLARSVLACSQLLFSPSKRATRALSSARSISQLFCKLR